jgi:hypothetical protein
MAYWKLDESYGASSAEDSFGTNNGTNHNITAGQTGQVNKAYAFNDSNSYIKVPTINTDEVTVSAWFYQDTGSTFPDTIFRGYRYNGDVQQRESYQLVFNGSDNLRFTVVTQNTSGTRTVKSCDYKFSGGSTGAWHCVAGTYSQRDGKQRLWVDGVNVSTRTHPAGNTIVPRGTWGDNAMCIGSGGSSYGYFNGRIDAVKLFNRPLTGDEIMALYETGY